VTFQTEPIDSPRLPVCGSQRLTAARLSVPSGAGRTLLLVVSLTMAAAIGSLWATEPFLPARTHAAFGVVVSIALAWSVFAVWVLARRRVLFGRDRVVASGMGLGFAALCTAGMLAVGYWGGVGQPAYVAALVETLLCGVAAVLLVRARRRVAALSSRRRELERQMGDPYLGSG